MHNNICYKNQNLMNWLIGSLTLCMLCNFSGYYCRPLTFLNELFKNLSETLSESIGQRITVSNMSDFCPRVVSSIPSQSHFFVAIDHEIIFLALLLPSTDSRRIVVSFKGKYVHKVLVNCLVKLAQEKVWT